MKLSEAIRLGAMLSPQAFGRLVDFNGARCAMGAAAEACGLTITDATSHEPIYAQWPWISKEIPTPPALQATSGDTVDIAEAIWKFNDLHRWTREQIADWVATVEPSTKDERAAASGLESRALQPTGAVATK